MPVVELVIHDEPRMGYTNPAQNEKILFVMGNRLDGAAEMRIENVEGLSDYPIYDPNTGIAMLNHPEWFGADFKLALWGIMFDLYKLNPEMVPHYQKRS